MYIYPPLPQVMLAPVVLLFLLLHSHKQVDMSHPKVYGPVGTIEPFLDHSITRCDRIAAVDAQSVALMHSSCGKPTLSSGSAVAAAWTVLLSLLRQ